MKKYFSKFKYVNLIFLWSIVLPIVFSVFIPNWRHHVRYLIPLIPFVNIAAVWMLLYLLNEKFFVKLKQFLIIKPKGLSYIVLPSFIYFIVYAIALGKNVDNINSQQLKLAHWVKENVPPGETIAINDIGAITYLNKHRIIDMAGLVTPEILRYRTYRWDDNLDSTNYLLKKNNVSYIIIYDEWFKEFLDKYGNNFTFVTSAVLEENTICGADEMKVYKTNYNSVRD